MMAWHLKDRELERKLNELSNGEFSKNLHEFDEDIFASYFGKTIRIKNYSYCTEGGDDEPIIERIPKFGFYFTKDELEEEPGYNPRDWNEFPKVKPPYNAIMRLEFEDATTNRKYYYAAFYTSDGWREAVENGLPKFVLDKAMIEAGLIKNVRFHIWDY